MNIYTPYTYLITHKSTGRRYYGVRYANSKRDRAHPSDLWTSYFTSSKVIHTILKEEGPEAFTYEVRKTFKDKASAIAWEVKVLTKLDAKRSNGWFNRANGYNSFYMTGHTEETKLKIGLASSQRVHSKETILKRAASRARLWKITKPDKTTEIISNLSDYCRNNNLARSCMIDIASNKQKIHRGYACERAF